MALAANLFLIGPVVSARISEVAGNAAFIIIRVVTLLGFAALLAALHGKTRLQIIGLTLLLELVDQGIFKTILLLYSWRMQPTQWEGLSLDGMIFGNFMSYLVFLPAILILSFVGAEIGHALRNRKATGRKPER